MNYARTVALTLLALAADANAQPRRRRDAGAATPAAPPAAPPAATPAAAVSGAHDFTALDGLLRAVVRSDGVDYAALRARLPELRALHDALAASGPRSRPAAYATSAAKRAFWLNAYNATVLRGIAEAPASLRSVEDIAPDFGFFRRRTWRIDGRALTLDQIEHAELLDVFHDPRFHTALNCGARSCPPLRAGIYSAASVDRELDQQATRYVNTPGSVVLDAAAHTVRVVQLFDWFGQDLARNVPGHAPSGATGPISFVYTFAAAPLRAQLVGLCGADGGLCRLTFTPYDWTLNNHR